MSQRIVTTLLVLAAGAVLVVAALRPARIGHPVTPLMDSAAESSTDRTVTTLPVDRDRPLVVVFVLPDCPCSIEYEPYVHRLYQAHGRRAAFVEVVAGDGAAAEEWKARHSVPFPVVSDPDRKIVREFGALRSAYTALVLNGRIAKLWPGYSADMLRELGGLIPTGAGVPVHAVEVNGAPPRLTSGCPL